MYSVLSCIRDEHSFPYVLAAVLVCSLGVTCSMIVFRRAAYAQRIVRRRIWAALSGLVLATGIWSTHFIAMLGYRPGFEFSFDGVPTIVSALIAVTGLMAASQIIIRNQALHRRIATGLLITATVGTMHYYGSGSLHNAALIEFDASMVIASVIISGMLFVTATSMRMPGREKVRQSISATLVLLAVACIHFIGMAGMTVTPLRGFHEVQWAVDPSAVIGLILTGVAVILLVAAMAAGFDSILSRLRLREQKKFKLLVNAASEAILIVDGKGEIVEVNDAASRLFQQSHRSLIGQTLSRLTGIDLSVEEEEVQSEISISAENEDIPVDLRLRRLDDQGGGLVAASFYDLRERLQNEATVRKLAYSDQLTGLPNRAAFQKALMQLWETSQPDSRQFGVFLIDLDQFKETNDQFGHTAGDTVLTETAARLRSTFGKKAIVARLGGDEFAALCPVTVEHDLLQTFAEDCVRSLSLPIKFDDTTIRNGASVGVAITDSELGIIDPGSLLTAADRALYAAKAAGRRTFRFYDARLHQSSEQKRQLETDLVRAVADNEFVLHYQPKVCSMTRRVLGYEALIRWERPGHGLVMPGAFIEFAERSQIIQDIGRWCIYEACREASSWEEELTVAVNLSARQFMDPNLFSTIRDALRKSGLAPHRLEMEITETALIQNVTVAARILNDLKKLGIKVALDDFGTGYSSMSFIQQFSFDRIKIDRSFVNAMDVDVKSAAIVDAILGLGASLSIPVVAEGVETEAQVVRLLKSRCAEFQGYLFSKPMPIADIIGPPRMTSRRAAPKVS